MPLILGILAQGVGAAPGAAGAYDLLETQVLSSSAASVTFTGLGSYTAYKHLQIRFTARTSTSSTISALTLQLNSDTGSNYAYHRLIGNGSTVTSDASTSQTSINVAMATGANATANKFSGGVIDLLDAFSSSKNTTIRSLSGEPETADKRVVFSSGLWNDTSAVTDITLDVANDFVTGSRFSLFGIR